MCNEVARRIALGQLRDDWSETRVPLVFPEGLPNLAATDSVRITDITPILRATGDGGAALVQRRWSWPGQGGRPVYNFRSEGRRFPAATRALVPVDGFYEFTAPADATAKRKDKWLFRWIGRDWFCIAAIWRTDPVVGEAFTLLTGAPGADVASYHQRQVCLLPPDRWGAWLAGEEGLLAPTPAGTLSVERV